MRIDTQELLELARELNRLYTGLDTLCMDLRHTQYQLPECIDSLVFDDIRQIRNRIQRQLEHIEIMKTKLVWVSESFLECEMELTKRASDISDFTPLIRLSSRIR